jgi:hypothetical protein
MTEQYKGTFIIRYCTVSVSDLARYPINSYRYLVHLLPVKRMSRNQSANRDLKETHNAVYTAQQLWRQFL